MRQLTPMNRTTLHHAQSTIAMDAECDQQATVHIAVPIKTLKTKIYKRKNAFSLGEKLLHSHASMVYVY